ncbi:MAG TPA: phosphate signaling complex protein PhoU, partial [Polyangia bacterium]
LAMAGLAEEMIDLTIQSLNERSGTKAEQVMAMDRTMDEWELKLDRLCIDMLALRAPAAGDLRLIASSLKIVPELERIGDHCCNIARRATYVHPPILSGGVLERLAQEVRSMVRMAVDSFIGSDAGIARTVIQADDSVDELYGKIYRELLRLMMSDPLCIERASHLILVVKNWERIADQATNIAEEVLFILEGRSAKHTYLQDHSKDM